MRSLACVLIAQVGIVLGSRTARADEASDAFRAGVRLLEGHRPREAVEAFHKAARLRPAYPQVFSHLGDAWLQLEKYDEAVASYRKSLEIDRPGQECLRALNGLGCAYLGLAAPTRKEDLLQEAIACLDQAIKVSPAFAPAYHTRGRAYHRKKELDRAMADFGKAIELAPGWADAYENRGQVWKDKGDAKRAEADFARARELRARRR
jgi:tetratricopeptide (TPR) repeat protein